MFQTTLVSTRTTIFWPPCLTVYATFNVRLIVIEIGRVDVFPGDPTDGNVWGVSRRHHTHSRVNDEHWLEVHP